MKMKSLILAAAILVPSMGFGAVNVITKNFATGALAATSNPIVFNGALAPAGAGIVAVGIFGVSDAALTAATPGTPGWDAAVASFTQFGASVTIGTGAGNSAGLFQSTPGSAVSGTAFDGKNVYVVIGNGTTLANSNSAVVFKSSTTFLAEPTPSVNAFLTDASVGADPAGGLLLGALGAAQVYYTTGPLANQSISAMVGVGVPEPSAALFGACASMLVFVRRRR